MKHVRAHVLGRVAIGAAALFLLLAGSAQAAGARQGAGLSTTGSIAYLWGGNVWVVRPDGSHRHQVTHDGRAADPYQYPTQADNGTIEVERHWTTLIHVDRNGRQLGPRMVVASGTSNSFSLHTLALGAAISPNGRWVASSILEYQGLYDPTTGGRSADIIAQDMYYYDDQTGKVVAKTHAAGTYFMSPSWMDNVHLLIFAPYNISAAQVIVDERNRPGWAWFADADALSFNRQILDQGELTRKRDKLALVRGTNLKGNWRGASLQIYSVTNLHAAPTALCSLKAQHGRLLKPTWSPDGTSLAWSDSSGVWVSPVTPGAANCGLSPRLVIPGGSSPDWGPTGVQ